MKKRSTKRQKRKPRTKETSNFEKKVVIPVPLEFDRNGGGFGPAKITFTINASPEDWHRLCINFPPNDEDMRRLGIMLYINALEDVCKHLAENVFVKKIRGMHTKCIQEGSAKTKKEFTKESKLYTAAAWLLASHWIARLEEQWPEWFAQTIRELKDSGDDITDKRNDKLNAAKIVYCMWKRDLYPELDTEIVKGPKDFRSFKQTYIITNPSLKWAKPFFSNGKFEKFIEKKGKDISVDDLQPLFPL